MKGFLLYVVFCVLIPYLLGSLSFSVIVSKTLYHQDIRNFGSGNAGMTNVLRTFGKKAAALTVVGDIGKGVVAVLLAKWFFGSQLVSEQSYFLGAIFGIYLAAFFAVLGHVYPLYFGFKGGKAVSVATGTIVAISPVMVLPLLVVFFWRSRSRKDGFPFQYLLCGSLSRGDLSVLLADSEKRFVGDFDDDHWCGHYGSTGHLVASLQYSAHSKWHGVQVFSKEK